MWAGNTVTGRGWLGVLVALLLAAAAAVSAQTAAPDLVLSWNADDPAVVGFFVYMGPSCGTWTNIANVGSATTLTVPGGITTTTCFMVAPYTVEGQNGQTLSVTVPAHILAKGTVHAVIGGGA